MANGEAMENADAASLPRVVIVGAGFGGLRAAKALKAAPVRVTLIDRHNYHLFQPLLYQVATALLGPAEIAYPIRTIFRHQRNVEFQLMEVTDLDLEGRCVIGNDRAVPYDYLILAVGSQTSYFGLDSIARHSKGLKDLDDAAAIRNHILTHFEMAAHEPDPDRRRPMLTFVIVGGGPTGVEMAGAISELIRLVLLKDYRRLAPREVRVVLLEALNAILPSYPESLQEATMKILRSKGVEVKPGARVEDFDGQRVTLEGGEVIPAHTLLWTAGVRAADLNQKLGARVDRQGRLLVEPTLNLPGRPEVYGIGDAVYLELGGASLPMVAPTAVQMGDHAARNVVRSISGKPPLKFQYKDPGALATIGRNAAVANVHGLRFKGFAAWVVWLVVHLLQLIGFRNRLVVLINWAWDYLVYDRGIRLIMPD